MHWIFSRFFITAKALNHSTANTTKKTGTKQNQLSKPRLGERGQGLIEYLVITALMGVATIAIVRTMGSVVTARFAAVTDALQGKPSNRRPLQIEKTATKKHDMGNFFEGIGSSGTEAAAGQE